MRKIKSIKINDAPSLSKWNELLKIIRALLKESTDGSPPSDALTY